MDTTELMKAGYRARSDKISIESLDFTALEPCLPFTDRASYLTWVWTEWRPAYAELSTYIRTTKDELKVKQRAGDLIAGSMQQDLAYKRFEARLMCRLRGVSKARSWELRNLVRRGEDEGRDPGLARDLHHVGGALGGVQ